MLYFTTVLSPPVPVSPYNDQIAEHSKPEPGYGYGYDYDYDYGIRPHITPHSFKQTNRDNIVLHICIICVLNNTF